MPRPGFLASILLLTVIARAGEASTLLDASSEGYPVHHAPYAVAAGDLDGDGIDDLVVADGDGAAILLANPDSTFQTQKRLPIGPVSTMTIAAVTDDPYADLIVLPTDRNVVRVFPGLGNGLFAASFDLPFLAGANGVVARDFDKDGRVDIAAAAGSTVTVWRAQGPGFASPQSFPVGNATGGLLAGDVDGDQDADLVVLFIASNGFAVLRNDGDGSFASAVAQPSPTASSLAACGDFDGDGVDDVAVVEPVGAEAGIVDVFPGRRDGSFGAGTSVNSTVPRPAASAVGDVDGNGFVDLVIATTSGFALHPGSATGLGPSGPLTLDRPSGSAIVIGAFDRDHHADLAIVEGSTPANLECGPYEGSTVYVHRGDASGRFHEISPLPGVSEARGLVTGDVDNDGAVDVFVTTTTPGIVALHGRSDHGFDAFPKTPLVAAAQAVRLVDVDGDGHREVVVSETGIVPGQIVIHDVASNGSLSLRATIVTGAGAGDFTVGDFDSDGHPDFAVVDRRANSVDIALSDKDGSWVVQPGIRMLVTLPITATDTNGDGKTDLVVGSLVGGDIFQPGWANLLGHGDGTFEFGPGAVGRLDARSVELAPPDGGDPTIALAEGRASCIDSDGGIELVRAVPAGLAYPPGPVRTGASPVRVRFGDVTGDGRLDLVSCTERGRIVVNVGKGDGVFAERLEFGVPGGAVDLALADVDRDGVLDVLAGGPSGVFLLHNQGAAHVDSSRVAARIGGGAPESILAHDRNGIVTLVLASDTRNDATLLDAASVRLAGAPPLPGRSRLVDEITRATYPSNVCDQVEGIADGRLDLEVDFPASDVLAGWLAAVGSVRVPPGAQNAALAWSARDRFGRVFDGSACAIVVGDDGAPPPARFASYGPASDRDLGVGVTLDLPGPVASSDVALFDLAGRRIATLYRGPIGPGFHRYAWAAQAKRPGIYFARARVDESVLTTRVLVLR